MAMCVLSDEDGIDGHTMGEEHGTGAFLAQILDGSLTM